MALSISRSNVLTKKTRSSEWADLRKSPPRTDDADLKDAIACVVKDRATTQTSRMPLPAWSKTEQHTVTGECGLG